MAIAMRRTTIRPAIAHYIVALPASVMKVVKYLIEHMNRLLLILLVCATACNDGPRHQCSWDLCPYRGRPSELPSKTVSLFRGSPSRSNINIYMRDMLHFEHPTETIEQINVRLEHYNKTSH